MTLDELLEKAGTVQAPPADLIDRLNSELAEAAHRDIARRALLVRRRRIGRFATVGVGAAAAAAVVGAIALQPTETRAPAADGPSSTAPVTPEFRTVAQVVNAAAEATPSVDPTAAPYWKVVTESHSFATWPLPDGTHCNQAVHMVHTSWAGNAGVGVVVNGGDPFNHDDGRPIATGPAVAAFGGRMLTWRQINAGQWTDAQIATMVTESGATPTGTDGRPPAAYYVFKSTAELLMSEPASPAIRKALWHNLASLPGVRLDGRAKDERGREGWQLSYPGPIIDGHKYGDEYAIVAPSSGQLLQSSVAFAQDANPSVDTLVSAGPAETAPTPQPQSSAPAKPSSGATTDAQGVPVVKPGGLTPWKQAAHDPMPYAACPADIASRG